MFAPSHTTDIMRIAHLSDLHLSPDHFPERTDAFYGILDTCISRRVDHIVITGDITNQAKEREFAHARAILREYGLLDPKKLTVTIGNHDIFGGPYYAEDVLSFPGTCRQTDYDAKVKEFHAAFREAFDGCSVLSGSGLFPFVKIVKEAAFVGINSVALWSSLRNPLGSNGDVGKKQLQRLREIFRGEFLKGKAVLVLIHHHFSKPEAKGTAGKLERLWHAIEAGTMKLWKKKKLFSLFQDAEVDGILHGHVHRHEEYERKRLRFLNAGGTMLGERKGTHRFHLLEVHAGRVVRSDMAAEPRESVRQRRRSA